MEYITFGESNKPSCLFLHGFLGAASDWSAVAEKLQDRFFCVLPELSSLFTGKSSQTFDSVSEELLDLLTKLNLTPTVLVGYSMGARIALTFASAHTEHCRALVLESGNPGIEDDNERQSRFRTDQKLAQRLVRTGTKSFLNEWYAQPLFESLLRRPELVEPLKAARESLSPKMIARMLVELSIGTQPPLWSKLSQLELPMLLVAGERDKKYQAILSEVHGLCKNSSLVVIKDAGHNTHLEQPAEFFRVVEQFLTGDI